jgi:ABC-2 type transport system permease protein
MIIPASRLRCYTVAASTAIRERLAYAGNFYGAMLTYALFVFIFSRVWAAAYAGQSSIAGYTRIMAVWYFIVAEVPSFGLGRFFWSLSRDMKSGQVAYLLARPYDFVAYHYAERFGGSLVDAAIILLEGLLVGLILVGPPPPLAQATAALAGANSGMLAQLAQLGLQAGRAVMTVLSLLLAGTLGFMLQFCIAMTAFWLEENDAFFWIYQKLMLIIGTLIPIEFLPAWTVRLVVWTPFPYLSYAPARIFVAFSWDEAWSLLLGQLVWIVLAVFLAKLIFAAGSRRISVNGG